MTNRKLLTRIAGGIVALFLAAILIWSIFFRQKFQFNEPGTVGNTAGNLYNSGLFVELDDAVYFANSFDGYALYSMKADETQVERMSNVVVRNLLAAGNYVYFFQNGTNGKGGFENVVVNRGFSRYNLTNGRVESLIRDIIVYNQLVDNYLYMLSVDKQGSRFFKMKIDKSEVTELGNSTINPACARDGIIYYAGVDTDHALHFFETADDIPHITLNRELWAPIYYGDWMYYLDLNTNYRLFRYNMSTGETQQLTTCRVDCFNVGSGYVYYQKNSSTEPELRFMQADGTLDTLIAEGNYTHINMTSRYVYFQEFGQEFTTYHCLIGSAGYSVFYNGRDAVPGFADMPQEE